MSVGRKQRIDAGRRKLTAELVGGHHATVSSIRSALRSLAELGYDARSDYESARLFQLSGELGFHRTDPAVVDEIMADPVWLAELCTAVRDELTSKTQRKVIGAVFEDGELRTAYGEPELVGASGWWPHRWWPDLPPWDAVCPMDVVEGHDAKADAIAHLEAVLWDEDPSVEGVAAALLELRAAGLNPKAEYERRLSRSIEKGWMSLTDVWPPDGLQSPGVSRVMPAFLLVAPRE